MTRRDGDHEEWIGLVPAAGKGLRLGLPYPKELYPIIRNNQYKPIAQYVVENLVSSGVKHIVFVINETKHQLIGYFGDGSRFDCQISYVVQEQREENGRSTSPGLAHALKSAYHLICGKTVFFGMADTIMTPRPVFRQALNMAQPEDDVILGLFKTTRPHKFGMVEMDATCRVTRIIDKPKQTTLENMWGFIIWRSIFTEHLSDCLASQKTSDFAQVMNMALDNGMPFRGALIEGGDYSDLGTYDEIEELEKKYRAL